MSSSTTNNNNKPVYIPRHKRKLNQPPVPATTTTTSSSTRNRWEQERNRQIFGVRAVDDGEDSNLASFQNSRKQAALQEEGGHVFQKPQDFMDDQDFQDFGGPTALHDDFSKLPARVHSDIDSLWKVDRLPDHVGERLIQAMFRHMNHPRKRFKSRSKDSTQDERTKIPEPKLDLCGLGYSPFTNAPEFQKYREERQRRARERAYAREDVYRVGDVLPGRPATESSRNEPVQSTRGPYTSYETLHDFIGDKSVGGFALRDDQDDTFQKDDMKEYDNVAYEYESEDEAFGHSPARKGVRSALSNWAIDDAENGLSGPTRTSDGMLPLEGFSVFLKSNQDDNKRFAGPDLPEGYDVRSHKFACNEHPSVFRALSHAESLEQQQNREKGKVERAVENAKVRPQELVGVISSMKIRFAPESVQDTATQTLPAGLSGPFLSLETPSPFVDSVRPSTAAVKKVTREVVSFVPKSLLCKRFGVRASADKNRTEILEEQRTTNEESFFNNVVLKEVGKFSPEKQKMKPFELMNHETIESEVDRPSMSIFRSVFDYTASVESSNTNEGSQHEEEEAIAATKRDILDVKPSYEESKRKTTSKKKRKRKDRYRRG